MVHILIATDGTPRADMALHQGGYIAEAANVLVTLLTVITNESGRVQADAILARAASLLPAFLEPETRIRVGLPAEQIGREATWLQKEGENVLLILGGRAHHGLAKRILAPTVERVLQQMPCPVLIMRDRPRPLKRLLLCESGREPSLLQWFMAQLSPILAAAEVLTVLHVMSQMAAGPGVPGWALRANAGELMEEHTPEGRLLEEDLARLERLPVHVEAKVRHGLVVKEIVKEAGSGDHDLVVIGAHRGSRWERFLLDDLAQGIIDHVDRSVLVV